jgi:hypothetical protein
MTSSTSNILRSSLVIIAALLLWVGRADAGRRRIVVLDFEGPKAEKFHDDVVKLIKKSHTVLKVDKWNETADELDAGKVTEKNVKKIAKKLKVDGVITGKIEKRRDEYIIRLKLRAGTTGEIIGNSVQTKAEGPRLDAQAQRDIKDELVAAIEELDSNRNGDDEEEEEEDTPKKKKKKVADDEEEEEPRGKSGFGRKSSSDEEEEEETPKSKKKKAEEEAEAKRLAKEEEDKRKKDEEKRKKDEEKRKKDEAFAKRKTDEAEATAKKDSEEEEEEDAPKKDEDEEDEEKPKKRKASADDADEEGITEEGEAAEGGGGRDLSPGGRAIDAVVGMSFIARNLSFTYASDLGRAPPGYKQKLPVAGGMVDVTAYPLAFGKTQGILRGIGLSLFYDQVIKISSRKPYADGAGMQKVATLATAEARWAVGPVFRYPIGKIVVGGSITYGRQKFSVDQRIEDSTLQMPIPTDIPNVHYTMITPGAFVRYPVTPKININGDLAFHAITDTGQIQKSGTDGYGAATVTGFELEAGADYMIMKNIFARVGVRYETIGIKFKGDPTSQSNTRDSDPDQDVSAARDTYFGGTVTVGYVY